MLCFADFGILIGQPANGGWVKQKLGAAEGRQPRGFRKPLVPADERPEFAVSRVVRFEAEISGSEIKLFVIKRIVRDMHLAILAGDLARRVDQYRGVVIDAGSAFFEERSYDHDFSLPRHLAQSLGRWTGNGFGKFEKLDVFRLAEVLGP